MLLLGKIGQIGSKRKKKKKQNQLIRHVNIHAQQLKAVVDPIRAVSALHWSCYVSDVGFCNGKLLVHLVSQITISCYE